MMNALSYTLFFALLLVNVIYADTTIGIRGGGGRTESDPRSLDKIQKQQHYEHHNYDHPNRRDDLDWGGYGDGPDEVNINPDVDNDNEEEDYNDDDSEDNDEDNEDNR